MLWQHFTVSTIIAIALYPFLGLWSLVVYVTGFLIDSDHYLFYIIKKKSWNIKKAYRYFRTETQKVSEYKKMVKVFHFLEYIPVMLIASLFHTLFIAAAIGFVAHIIMDFIYEEHAFGSVRGYSLLSRLSAGKQKAL